MAGQKLEVLARSCSVPSGNRVPAVQEQWPRDTSGRMFEEDVHDLNPFGALA
ncbi:MAG: hypothetical protein ACRDRJ_39120 [Streptosporangiaceae bacterium]